MLQTAWVSQIAEPLCDSASCVSSTCNLKYDEYRELKSWTHSVKLESMPFRYGGCFEANLFAF